MSLAYDVASALMVNGRPEKNKDGWLTCCPLHGDKKPSLAVTDNDKGDVDVYCHTGCNWKEVKDLIRTMGLLPEWGAAIPISSN